MKKRCLLFVCMLLFCVVVCGVPFVSSDSESWVFEDGGKNFDLYHSLTDVSLKRWVSASERVLDESGDWVDYVCRWDSVEGCYVVETALISAKIFEDGSASFWSMGFSDERVRRESWQVWRFNGVSWVNSVLYGNVEFGVSVNGSGVFVETRRLTTNPDGELTVLYRFDVGGGLKHFVFWENFEKSVHTVEVRQVWTLASSVKKCKTFSFEEKVAVEGGDKESNFVDVKDVSGSGFVDAERFVFEDVSGVAVVFEDQSAMVDKLTATEFDFGGGFVSFRFSSWTLASGEVLVIDPDTTLTVAPTKDSYVSIHSPSTNYGSSTSLDVYGFVWFGSPYISRSLLEFDLSSIPTGSSVVSSELQLYCYSYTTPTINIGFARIISSWEENAVIWTNQPSGAPGYLTYAGPSGSSQWYNRSVGSLVYYAMLEGDTVGFSLFDLSEDEGISEESGIAKFYSKEFSGTDYDPKLEVVYSAPPVYVTLDTVPSGLSVQLDGGSWFDSPHTFEVENGSSHSINCMGVESGGEFVQYVFSSWNDSGANPHSVSPTANTTYVATYDTEYKAKIISYPEGSGFVEVNSTAVSTPYTTDWLASGSNITVTATNKTITASQERLVFDSWSDGGAISHNVSVDGSTYSLYFNREWYFAVSSLYGSPTGQGWYVDGATTVNSSVTSPASGNDVSGWVGTGSLSSGSVGASNSTGVFTISEYSTCVWTWSVSPSFSNFDCSKSSVEPSEVFNVSAVVVHPSGVEFFENCSVGLGNGVVLFWDNASDVFSLSSDTHGYVTLSGGGSTALSGTSVQLDWILSLNSQFPSGSVDVVEFYTKVFDNSSLLGSGSSVGLFVFDSNIEGSSSVGSSSGSSNPVGAVIDDYVAPTVFTITNNVVTMVVMAIVGLLCVYTFYSDNPLFIGWAWKVFFVLFVLLAVNFCLVFFVAPYFVDLEVFGVNPFDLLLRLPSITLSNFEPATQTLLQILTMVFVGMACVLPIVEVSRQRG